MITDFHIGYVYYIIRIKISKYFGFKIRLVVFAFLNFNKKQMNCQ